MLNAFKSLQRHTALQQLLCVSKINFFGVLLMITYVRRISHV
jgi:hypothetical protein